jgi:hypothetical protein
MNIFIKPIDIPFPNQLLIFAIPTRAFDIIYYYVFFLNLSPLIRFLFKVIVQTFPMKDATACWYNILFIFAWYRDRAFCTILLKSRVLGQLRKHKFLVLWLVLLLGVMLILLLLLLILLLLSPCLQFRSVPIN